MVMVFPKTRRKQHITGNLRQLMVALMKKRTMPHISGMVIVVHKIRRRQPIISNVLQMKETGEHKSGTQSVFITVTVFHKIGKRQSVTSNALRPTVAKPSALATSTLMIMEMLVRTRQSEVHQLEVRVS